ncbi:MAG TPA: PDDEXK nuclease domain-containing protein [Verrucomicrobiota bacterium]|nr:PDDEXK nuclease domain-containing protein [Verrucomicrobiota bacterium]
MVKLPKKTNKSGHFGNTIKDKKPEISNYLRTLEELKGKIRKAQYRAALSVNSEMTLLYWDIGWTILRQQKGKGWGAKVIDRLAYDLKKAFPNMKGFSSRNLKYMRALADAYSDKQIVQQLVAQIPWGHNVRILDYVKNHQERLWYINETIKNGWSRNVLVHQIESQLYQRQKTTSKITNFTRTLPSSQSDLAQQTIKDPYIFDFLNISQNVKEIELQNELIKQITKFLLELGAGFSFVGSQYHIEVAGKDFYIDLLFYHLKLRCYVVIELKTGDFKPEYAGQLNFYLSAVDSLIKSKEDNPTIGIILCKNNNHIIAEYALRNITKPIGVSEYKMSRVIPKTLRKSLPSVKEIEKELRG